jgi:ATP-binding cassette, subfamily B (MDR/TAP), member 1
VKKADDIFVMGDGELIERGTHTELLKANGAYARLVKAQTLREAEEVRSVDEDSISFNETGNEKAEEKILAPEDVYLERQKTSHSLASDVIRQKQGARTAEGEKMSIGSVFARLVKLGRDQWTGYSWGALFAARKCLCIIKI